MAANFSSCVYLGMIIPNSSFSREGYGSVGTGGSEGEQVCNSLRILAFKSLGRAAMMARRCDGGAGGSLLFIFLVFVLQIYDFPSFKSIFSNWRKKSIRFLG
jgi:hypothetical protein